MPRLTIVISAIGFMLAGCTAKEPAQDDLDNLMGPPASVTPMSAAAHTAFAQDERFLQGEGLYQSYNYGAGVVALRAIADENPLAAMQLAQWLESGEGLRHDPAEAVRFYRQAAMAGYAPAQAVMGEKYAQGDNVPQNWVWSNRWYRLAADQGEDMGSSRLARQMLRGEHMPRDIPGALKILHYCADLPTQAPDAVHPNGELGGVFCQSLLGEIYETGVDGIAADPAQAVVWYQRAAKFNLPFAEARLAVLYAAGRGVEKDDVMAAMWRRRAAQDAGRTPSYWQLF